MIGSGVFMKPSLMAAQLGSPFILLSVWIVAGIITLFGALSNAEVAAMFPETGGQYIFFKKMYGHAFAFVYGWAAFAVFNTGGVASIAYVCAQYSTYFIKLPVFAVQTEHSICLHIPAIGDIYPLENAGVKGLTIILVIVFTAINYWSTKYGGWLQTFLTALKTGALAFLILGIQFSGKGSMHHVLVNAPSMPVGMAMFSAYIAAIAGAFWAYDGWNNISFVAGEIINPQKNIPKSLFSGLLIVIIIYTMINLAYVYILPISTMSNSHVVAADAAQAAWGTIGGIFITLMVILSTLGTANGNILAVARVTFAMKEESRWFRWAGKVHPKFHTPGNALILNAIWTVLLIITGSFDTLTDMLIFVTWFFYGMSILGVFILRKKMPDVPRSYKVWGYPIVPLFFVCFTAFFLLFTLYQDITNYRMGHTVIINSLLGILITCIGIPVYYLSRIKFSNQ